METAQTFKPPVVEDEGDESDEDAGTGVIGHFDEDSLSKPHDIPTTNRSSMDEVTHNPDQHIALRAGELGTSLGGTSLIGSLKSFYPHSLGARRTSSESNLLLAASVPSRRQTPLAMPVTRSTSNIPATDHEAGYYLGTSMPISIPHLQQHRGLSGTSPLFDGKKSNAAFIPPHLLESAINNVLGKDTEEDILLESSQSLNLSPSAAVKREKLMARNAILRSTGFIEVSGFAAPAVGEVIDVVKESTLASGAHDAGAVPIRRPTATSSLTTMLGTST